MEQNELYRAAFLNAAIGVSMIALEPLGKYVEVNPSFCRMTGYSRDELLERTFQSITLTEDLAKNIEELNSLLSGGSQGIAVEKRYVRKDGRAFWARLHISLIQEDRNKPKHLIVQIEDIDAQKRAQQALEEANRRHSTLLGNLRGMAYRCRNDADWTMEFVSEGCFDLTGYAPSDITGNRRISYGNIIHPEDQAWLWDKCQASLQARQPCVNEYRIRTASGQDKWVWEQARGIYSDGGGLEAVEGFITDITERKQAEDKLRFSRFSIERAVDAAFWMTPDARFFDVNESACRSLGYTREELLSMSVYNIDPDFPREAWDTTWQDLKKRGSLTLETRHRTKSGRIFPVEISANYLEFQGREYNCAFARDISERKNAEGKLLRQTAALHELHAIHTLPDLNEEKLCDEVVSAMASFYEVPVATAKRITGNQLEVLSLWEQGELRHGIRTPLAGTPCEHVRDDRTTCQYQGALNEQFPLDAFLSVHAFQSYAGCPIYDSRGEVKGVLNLVHDEPRTYSESDLQILELFGQVIGAFLERNNLEHQLRHAQKLDAIGQLSGGIAHEFNNLLTAMIGNLQLASKKTVKNKELHTLITNSDQAAHRAAVLTKQLLAFSRRAEVDLKPQDLHPIAGEVGQLLSQTIDRRITVTVESDSHLWPVLGDAAQMHQVIMNLCVNARDALMEELSRRKGSVPASGWRPVILIKTENISAHSLQPARPSQKNPGDYVCLSVMDNGCGIDSEIQSRVFEPFFTTKAIGHGTGLGLATAYGIIRQHNGWIELETEKNHSTTFRVFLPRTVRRAQPPKKERKPDKRIMGGQETVLLIDDEAPIRRLGETILKHHGYTVELAGDGTEALDLFSRQPDRFDLIILDLTMPKLSGWDTLKQIRQIRPQVRVIVSSGHRMDSRLKEISQSQDVRFMPKPYRPDDLARVVREVLDSAG